MDRDAIARLRLDRRLAHRPGWITPDELDSELSALPDVAGKGETIEDDEPEAPPAPAEG